MPHVEGHACIKRSSSPDISWVLSERGFSRHTNRVVWFAVEVDVFSDELRIGFTDDPKALLERSRFMSYDEPHAWLYSDGSSVRGIHGGGEHLSRCAPSFGRGDIVSVCLDFERDEATWFVNLHLPSSAVLVYTHRGLPPATIHAVIVLDEANDAVRFLPMLSSSQRQRGDMLRTAAGWAAASVAASVGAPSAAAAPLPVEGVAYVASRFLKELEVARLVDDAPLALDSRLHPHGPAEERWAAREAAASGATGGSAGGWACSPSARAAAGLDEGVDKCRERERGRGRESPMLISTARLHDTFARWVEDSGVAETVGSARPPWMQYERRMPWTAYSHGEFLGWRDDDDDDNDDDDDDDDHAGWQAMAGARW